MGMWYRHVINEVFISVSMDEMRKACDNSEENMCKGVHGEHEENREDDA
jgi:hypothetical protein